MKNVCLITEKSLRFTVFIICSSLFIITRPVLAQTGENEGAKGFVNGKVVKTITGKTYAVILGISTYTNKIKSLKYADADAELFKDYLMSAAGGGLKETDILFLKNEKLKWSGFIPKLDQWMNSVQFKAGDRLFVYFSGHGDAYKNNYYLLTYDCDPQSGPANYSATALNMHYIKSMVVEPLTDAGVKVIMIVDACRTNELPPGGVDGIKGFSRLINSTEQVPGQLMMFSTEAGTEAFESKEVGNGHGLFTYYLIDGLYGMADTEGPRSNKNGTVEFYELSSWVTDKVMTNAQKIFKVDQIPVFKQDKSQSEVMSVVNNESFVSWTKLKEATQLMSSDVGSLAQNINREKKPGTAKSLTLESADTLLYALNNKFNDAIKQGTLEGNGSAEDYYNQMQQKWPGNAITEDARYELAGELLDFGQQKINLYLSGKGIAQIRFLESSMKQNSKAGEESKTILPEAANQIDKMKKVVNTNFATAAKMMEKAIGLLKGNPKVVEAISPKLYFLKAAALNNTSNKAKLLEGIAYCRKAIKTDPNAAYNYLLMGQLMYDMKNDSCEYYYKKAAQLAPGWAYPVNGLGNYYSDNNKNKLAIQYYKQAIALDTLNSFVVQNLGSIYHNLNQPDSAKYYYYKALVINPHDAYSNGNLGSLFTDSVDFSKPDGKYYFKLAKNYLKKSIHADPDYIWSYNKLAALFAKANQPDSSSHYLHMAITADPENAEGYRNLADRLFMQKDTVAAEKWYIKGVEADKADITAHLELGYFYSKTGKLKKAMEVFNAVEAKFPNKPDVYNYMGIAYNKTDKQKALLYYKKALTLNPDLNYVLSNIGGVYAKLGNTSEAINYYNKALAVDSGYVTAYQGLGSVYLDNYQYKEAINYYLKAYKLDPVDLTTNFNLGYIYRKLELYDKAIPYYETVLALDPADPDPYHSLGMIYHNKEDLDKAEMYFTKALKLDAEDADLHWHVASVNADRGNEANEKGDKQTAAKYYEIAISAYTEGSKYAQSPVDYLAQVGELYYSKDGIEKAVAYYNNVLKSYPKAAVIPYSIGQLYRAEKKYDEALNYYQASLKIDSMQTDALGAVAGIYLLQNKKEKAHGYLDRAIHILKNQFKTYPEDDKLASDIAFLYFRKYDYESALPYFKQAIAINPTPYYYHYYGHANEYTGNTQAALDNFLLYIETKPDNAEIYAHVGDMYRKLKNYQQSINYYKKGLELEETEKLYTGLGYAYLYTGEVEQAVAAFEKAIKIEPEKNTVYYNLACAYSIQKNATKALENLKIALEKGYDNYENVMEDTDIEFVRQQPGFKQLISTYFPDK